MAKTARKGAPLGHKSTISQKSNPRFYAAARPGGKSINTYQYNPSRRFSIAESSSSESSDGLAGKDRLRRAGAGAGSGSDSDSSLTAMSEEHEKAASRKGSVIFEGNPTKKSSSNQRRQKGGKAAKSVKTARKGITGKTVYYRGGSSDEMSEDDDRSDVSGQPYAHFYAQDSDDDIDENDENDEENEDQAGLAAFYSMVGSNSRFISSQSDISNDEDSPDDGSDSSSSDDSEVDFVRLQVERKKNAGPGSKAKKPEKPPKAPSKTDKPKRRKSSVFRRRSEVAIPEDINFKFDFDEPIAEHAVDDKAEEEDLGEEVAGGRAEEGVGKDDSAHKPEPFAFDAPLLEVPKIDEAELNSDDEYAFDDNDLLATLQADNDFEDFITDPKANVARVRQGSLSSMNSMTSMNDDEIDDSFLREEEKYLVNEFETNGFDDDEMDAGRLETAHAVNSLNAMGPGGGLGGGADAEAAGTVQYASSSDGGSRDSDLDLDDDDTGFGVDADADDGEYVDFIDFDSPFFDESPGTGTGSSSGGVKEIKAQRSVEGRARPKKAHFPRKKRGPLDSDDEDDAYLWNYFFSSDAESYSGSEIDRYDADEQLVLEEVFRQNLEARKQQLQRESSMEPADSENDNGADAGYDSGESTDVDLSLPAAGADSGVGSKSAKEVLSSKTADYRPPVLGTWAAIDSKPFGIIDGLSTRTLNHGGSGSASANANANASNSNKPRTKNWRSFSIKNPAEDSAIELEELLNVSELDNEDENDARIWRDFNNNKKHVPLGAFRNKAHLHHAHVAADPMAGYSVAKNTNFTGRRRHSHSHSQVKAKLASRNLQGAVAVPIPASAPSSASVSSSSSLAKDLNLPSKSKLRRASIADAVSEGYRPTKSGLFSENMLADVEEILGDDRDFMALVSGL